MTDAEKLAVIRRLAESWHKGYGVTAPSHVDDLDVAYDDAGYQILHILNEETTGGWLVWDKVVRNFSSGHCELAWTSLDQPVRAFNFANGSLATEGKVHPTQKPLSLMQWCIDFMTGTSVADPFAGSGTTLVAARNMGLKAIGVEIEERYCEIIARRLDQMCLDFEEGA